jgi:hypothetical protein
MKFLACLGDNNMVSHRPRVVDLPHEASVEQILDFFTDEILPLNLLLLGPLLHRPSIGVDLPRDPGHL